MYDIISRNTINIPRETVQLMVSIKLSSTNTDPLLYAEHCKRGEKDSKKRITTFKKLTV